VAVMQLAAGQHRASQSSLLSPVLCTVNFDLHHYHALWTVYAVIMVSIIAVHVPKIPVMHGMYVPICFPP
jgi:hypothetical protein